MRSPRYCAPEVAANKPRNSSSDIWSLGCVFLEMIAVLKKKTRKDIYNVIVGYSNEEGFFNESKEGIQAVINWLREEGPECKKPLDWVEKMMPWEPQDRIKANGLRDCIRRGGNEYSGVCCFKSNLEDFKPPNQSQDTSMSSYLKPPRQDGDIIPATILVLGRIPMQHSVKMVRYPGLKKNLISFEFIKKFNPKTDDYVGTESVQYGEEKFRPVGVVEITWKFDDANSGTHKEEFMVVLEAVKFDVLVTQERYDSQTTSH
ncbi:hypothetical protein F4805DRAFT_291151 [Annulohypoxylon moriforme]|nr:hypothetical protein F4805DRAFT_291151 [Annulohypoxylon moriforme]